MTYDFNVKKLEGKVQIDVNNWLYPENNILKIHRISGKSHMTYITTATYVGDNNMRIATGDYILLSKVACEVATSPTMPYEIGDGKRYFNVPIEQVIGVFSNHLITPFHLTLKNSNILFHRINKYQDSTLAIEEKGTMLGKVLSTSETSSFKVGDIIVVRDNVSTPIKFEESEYFAVEEKFIVGVFHNRDFSLQNLDLLNEYIIMKPYVSTKVLNSTILETPSINYEDLDYSDINNRNLFKVIYADKTLTNIKEGDIVLLNRDYTNYMYFENEKYFVINDKKWLLGKIIERDN